MNTTLLYEVAVIALGVGLWYALFKAQLRFAVPGTRSRDALKAQGLSEAQAAVLIIGALAVVGSVAGLSIFNASTVKACESNLKAIETALNAYKVAVGSFPATTAASVVVYNGTTAGTFSNPNQISTDYLGQATVDPANPTGSYKLTYVAPTATAGDSYTIVCPGIHTKGDLTNVPGAASETAGKIELLNGQGFQAI